MMCTVLVLDAAITPQSRRSDVIRTEKVSISGPCTTIVVMVKSMNISLKCVRDVQEIGMKG